MCHVLHGMYAASCLATYVWYVMCDATCVINYTLCIVLWTMYHTWWTIPHISCMMASGLCLVLWVVVLRIMPEALCDMRDVPYRVYGVLWHNAYAWCINSHVLWGRYCVLCSVTCRTYHVPCLVFCGSCTVSYVSCLTTNSCCTMDHAFCLAHYAECNMPHDTCTTSHILRLKYILRLACSICHPSCHILRLTCWALNMIVNDGARMYYALCIVY